MSEHSEHATREVLSRAIEAFKKSDIVVSEHDVMEILKQIKERDVSDGPFRIFFRMRTERYDHKGKTVERGIDEAYVWTEEEYNTLHTPDLFPSAGGFDSGMPVELIV